MELIALATWISAACVVAWLSYRKDEGVVLPLVISLVLSPFVGLVVVLFSCYGKAESDKELAELKAIRRQLIDLTDSIKAHQSLPKAPGISPAVLEPARPLTEAEMIAQVQAEEVANARRMRKP